MSDANECLACDIDSGCAQNTLVPKRHVRGVALVGVAHFNRMKLPCFTRGGGDRKVLATFLGPNGVERPLFRSVSPEFVVRFPSAIGEACLPDSTISHIEAHLSLILLTVDLPEVDCLSPRAV